MLDIMRQIPTGFWIGLISVTVILVVYNRVKKGNKDDHSN